MTDSDASRLLARYWRPALLLVLLAAALATHLMLEPTAAWQRAMDNVTHTAAAEVGR